ncbi:hypothetical protein [Lentzea sp. CC55]|uniref:hypothetical protein n=1 Tax=Lentzea sp. CC55 TaxID=2884909 RepID=UPI001F2042D7|nr:hypothetical protein [Lentzea sp. CC55]MCG8924938.1 hypothetical protein [Lentzea sp. CC55]
MSPQQLEPDREMMNCEVPDRYCPIRSRCRIRNCQRLAIAPATQSDETRDSATRRIPVTTAKIRAVALTLPRTTKHLIRDRVKFRGGQIVLAALSRDETVLGFGHPREEREALVASDPVKFAFPSRSDMRFQRVHARMAEPEVEEMTELVIGAWTLCAPKKVIRARLGENLFFSQH